MIRSRNCLSAIPTLGLLVSSMASAHYPILNCHVSDASTPSQIICEAGFSDRSKAPNVLMEVFSEDDELLVKGKTSDTAMFEFERPEGDFFIIMDAGPGHVLEISNEEVDGS